MCSGAWSFVRGSKWQFPRVAAASRHNVSANFSLVLAGLSGLVCGVGQACGGGLGMSGCKPELPGNTPRGC